MADDVRLRRLRWRSRRGLRELDLLLMPFVENVYPTLDVHEQATYQRLLEQEDTELQAWFNGRGRPLEPDMAAMIERIRAHARCGD